MTQSLLTGLTMLKFWAIFLNRGPPGPGRGIIPGVHLVWQGVIWAVGVRVAVN
jgi:hypothetical protein